ncbi:MAG: SRPBCC family protein [Methylophilaceae bacterium]|nr:MAG: SRPBCC family protein [Methylophilaceae bacterium]
MKKFLALIALSVFSITAAAHGPTPQKIDEKVIIKAEPAKVWEMVKDYENAQKWLPTVKNITVEKKGSEIIRTLNLKNGGKIKEKISDVDDAGMKIKFEVIEGVPASNYNPYISVSKGPNAGESEVRFFHRFYRFYPNNPPIPDGQDEAAAIQFINETYVPGNQHLKKVIENSK